MSVKIPAWMREEASVTEWTKSVAELLRTQTSEEREAFKAQGRERFGRAGEILAEIAILKAEPLLQK